MRRARVWWLGIGMLLSAVGGSLASAQPVDERTVQGVVRDGSGAAVAGVAIVVEAVATAITRVVDSGGDGGFSVKSLPTGTYRLTIVATGFEPVTREVVVPGAEVVAVVLQPAPVVEVVRVFSASKQEELRHSLNTRVDVISRARIEESGAESVGEVLRELPGVLTRRGSETAGQAGQQVQGIDSRQVLVLLDGQPIPSARGIKRGIVNLDRQSTARLERIEVVKGAASALYGSDAIGGVINLITRDVAAPFDVHTSVSGGSAGDFNARAEAGLRRRRWSTFVIGERHQHDGFDLTPTTFDTTGAPFRRFDGLVKGSVQVHPSLTLSGLFAGYSNHSTGRSNGELGPQEDDIDDATTALNVAAEWSAGATTSIQSRAYVSRYRERSTGQLAPPAATALEPGALDEDVAKLDVSLSTALGTRQQLQAGVEYWDNQYAGINRLAFDGGVAASTVVGWAQHRLTLGPRVTTTVGARVDRHSAFGTAVSPKIAANVRVAEGLHARASFGGGFRAPDLGQLYYRFLNPSNIYQVIGNPELQPEYAQSLQVGADWLSSSRRARLGFNVFHNDVDDLIESVSLGMVVTPAQLAVILAREGLDPSFRPVLGRLLFTYKNVSDAFTRGLEVDGEVAAVKALSVSGAYTFLQARDAQNDRDLTGRHRHHGHLRLAWHWARAGLRTSLRATAYSSWIAARVGTVDTIAPAFVLWDLSASQPLPAGLALFGAIDNLTDNQDPNTGVLTVSGTPAPIYRPEIGRTIRFGVRWGWTH